MSSSIKGRNQHVMPSEQGWCVIDEVDRRILHHFETVDKALRYAHRRAKICEGEVLVHKDPDHISGLLLPQEHFMRDGGSIEEDELERDK